MNVTIEIDEGSGFCFGVTTAIRKAEEELAHGGSLYCLGDIVHNGSECERLRALGLATIDHEAFGRLHDAKVLLRAHGEPPETYATAHENRINIIDATCPVVLQLQRRIKHVADSEPDAQLVIYGKPGHAEVIGLVGQTAGRAIVIERPEDVERLDLRRDIRLFSQTTQPLEGFRRIVDYITAHIVPPATFRPFDTICRQVANRLPNIRTFASRHDVILFVRPIDLEQIDCGLNRRLSIEQFCWHANAGKQRVSLQQPLRIYVALSATCVLLNKNSTVSALHLR